MPHKRIAKYSRPPLDWAVAVCIVAISANGTGIKTSNLYNAKQPSVQRILVLIDFVARNCCKVFNMSKQEKNKKDYAAQLPPTCSIAVRAQAE